MHKCHVYVLRKFIMETYLLIKYLKCSATAEEEALVREWLADDPDGSHARQYSDAHFIYEGMLLHGDGGADAAENSRPVRRGRLFRIAAALSSVAAAAAVVLGVWFWTRNSTLDSLSARMETIYVPAGKSMELTLEDGSKLWLNSGTELEYPTVFSRKSRDVKINSGEVLFDVTKDSRRPFNVDTYASRISVLGTRFNVTVDEASKDFSAALLRGSIKVANKLSEGEEYILKANQMVKMKDDHLYVEQIEDPDAVECWTSGLIDIVGVPFDRLMKKFEMAYDVDIVIERDTVPEIRYTRGKLRVSDGIDHALSMLALVADFTYEYDRQTGTIVIR